jgi:NADH:ubiquinone oxidoreductase subunit 6 (subunit J)
MNPFSLTPTQLAGGQIALAAALAVAGFAALLPRPAGRRAGVGVAALVAAAAVLGTFLYTAFGTPSPDALGTVLFTLFSAGALGFGTVLVTQRTPARGAIAFAFVVLSTCGLFLLLAAPFLMAATVIIYAGAIIVTFLFVLMLSHAGGPSDENDRTREPLFGSLAGFAFTGLVLFTLYLTQTDAGAAHRLPVAVLTADERAALAGAVNKIDAASAGLDGDLTTGRFERQQAFEAVRDAVSGVVGVSRDEDAIRDGSLPARLEKTAARGAAPAVLYREDEQARGVLRRAAAVRELNWATYKAVNDNLSGAKPDGAAAKAELRRLRDEVLLLAGSADLPARNVGNLGYLLYTDHLLAVELAGTLLLVAVIGAVAIAHRRRGADRADHPTTPPPHHPA